MRAAATHHDIAIVGTGFGGLGAAIALVRDGHDDVVLLERADDLGGTWRDNTYPGCACDVPSHLYSFSFAPNPDWSRRFSRQPEIWEYLRRCARDHDLLRRIRYGHELTAAAWDDDAACWRLETSQGLLTTRVLVIATGPLSEPVTPSLRGIERFRGDAFHSARWRADVELRGRRVAVLGTGASAAQLIPEIQPIVERLYVFQRTPAWVMPRRDRALGERTRALFRRAPALQRAVRQSMYLARELMVFAFRDPALMRRLQFLSRRHLQRAVRDPGLRAKLTPDYTMGCKRIIVSDDYCPALAQPNVEVVSSPIAEVREHSIVDADGNERAVDVIVYATGFRPTDPPLAPCIRGRDGRTLADVWCGSPHAHLGTTMHGFPNLFLLLGPNTGLGHNSVVLMEEAQIRHLVGAAAHMRAHGLVAIEPTAAAQAEWLASVDRRMVGTVWDAGGCRSWYVDRTGRIAAIWPDFTWRFERRVGRFEPREYASYRGLTV